MNEQILLYAKSKDGKTVVSHLLDTAAVCFTLLTDSVFKTTTSFISSQTCIDIQDVISSVSYIAGLHDIGKIHPIFQKKVYDSISDGKLWKETSYFYTPLSENRFRHEIYSADVLVRIWKNQGYYSSDAIECCSNIIGLHHQGKNGNAVEINKKDREIWWKYQNDAEQSIRQVLHPQKINDIIEKANNKSAVCMMILGIVILSDWIASSKAFSQEKIAHYEVLGYEKYFKYQVERCKLLIKQSWLSPIQLIVGTRFSDVWRNIPPNRIRPLQACMESVLGVAPLPLLTIVEAPMGEGKTECGIYAAIQIGSRAGKDGMYIALPTAATSNQMYERTKEFLQSHNINHLRLLHSTAWMLDDNVLVNGSFSDIGYDDDQLIAQEWTKPVKRGLLEPYCVGTIDQVLMAALRVKYGVLRLVGMQEKVLLLDEVHAYDAYMQDIILRMLEWCKELNIPVIMLSATLATSTKEKMLEVYGANYKKEQEYPAITTVYDDQSYKTTMIPDTCNKRCITMKTVPFLNDESQVIQLALNYVEEGGCICIMMNTVQRAQNIYKKLSNQISDDIKLLLFHARFSVKRRNELEAMVTNLFGKDKTNRPAKAILVCTQVVEQSLDVDFDTMISDIAPIDLILQRSGRVFRHDDTIRPEAWRKMNMTILVPEDDAYGVSAYIYPEILLSLTNQYLQENKTLNYPESIRGAVEYVYGDNQIKETEMEKWMEKKFNDQLAATQASIYELPEPDPDGFYIYNSDKVFDDNNSSTFLSAKTRLSDPSIRIAAVEGYLFQKLVSSKYVGIELAKQVMEESVNISMKTWKRIEKRIPENVMIEGTGLLNGIVVLNGIRGVVPFTDGGEINMDEQIGFEIIEKEVMD